MTREALERLLETVSDVELETLRDAILREEGRRRAGLTLTVPAPYPPLVRDEHLDLTIARWASLLTWLAKDTGFPPATGKRGISIAITYTRTPPDPQEASIILQQALVRTGLLVGRTAEWVDATTTQVQPGTMDLIVIQLWEKPTPLG